MNATNLKRKRGRPAKPVTTLNRFKRQKPKLIALYYNWPLFKSPYSFFEQYKLNSKEDRQNFLGYYQEVIEMVDFAFGEAKAKEFNVRCFISERKKLRDNLIQPMELYKDALFIINLCIEFSVIYKELLKRGKL